MFSLFATQDNTPFNPVAPCAGKIPLMDDESESDEVRTALGRLLLAGKALKPKKIKNKKTLAEFLGLLPQNVNNWRNRGVPKGMVNEVCRKIGCSADWVELGIGPIAAQKAVASPPAQEGPTKFEIVCALVRAAATTAAVPPEVIIGSFDDLEERLNAYGDKKARAKSHKVKAHTLVVLQDDEENDPEQKERPN